MGKTRLSLELARQALMSESAEMTGFRDGVYFVELAPLSDPSNIVSAIAEATSFQFQTDDRSPKQQVLDFLGNKNLLLVMDNYEHLLEGAGLVTEILKAAPDVKIVATSRQRLNQLSETIFNLQGMNFPAWETPADALEYAAVKLFVQSARRARPDFEVTEDNMAAIARICKLVQGMPLGIVMAAAWMGMLSAKEIAAEIAQSIDFLTSDMGEIPDRQRSMRVIFDYSWDLMADAEKQVFMKLAVFRGGFTRQAGQAVTGATLQQLMSLVNKSLLRRDNNSGRYEIHELLRQYAAEKLTQSGAELSTRNAHMTCYANAMHEREVYLKDNRQIQALDEIEADFENVRMAWFWAIEQQDGQALDAMVASLCLYAEYRNHITECLELLDLTIPLESTIAEPIWGRLLARRGHLCDELMRFKEAESYVAKALTIARKHNNEADIAFSLWKLAGVITNLGTKEAALKYAEESLALYQALGDAYGEAALYNYLGYLHDTRFNNITKGLELTKKSYAIAQTFGQPTRIASCLHNLGIWEVFLGDMNTGEAYLRDSVRLRQQAKTVSAVVFSMSALMWVAVYHGRFEQAEADVTEMIYIATDSGNQMDIYWSHCHLAALRTVQERYQETLTIATAMRQLIESYTQDSRLYFFQETAYGWALCGLGNYAEAMVWTNQALLHAAATAQPAQLNFILLGKSILFAANGNYKRALEVLALIRHDPSSRFWRDRMPLALRLVEQLKAHFSEEMYNVIYERGTRLNWRETVNQLAAEVAEDNT
jgi:predicted ATPase